VITELDKYLQLTKPRVMMLVVFSGITALMLEGSLIHHPIKFMMIIIGLYLTGGCANSLNQYFEREIDARMERTRLRRPLPRGIIPPHRALIFSILIGIMGIFLFGFLFNWLTAMLSLATIVFYGFFYTLWLKPKTYFNIVIGGIAGAMAPVGVWAAATGSVSLSPLILFLIIFFWTPPHFWALALFYKDDYRQVGLPMLPVAKGDLQTSKQIFYYSIFLFVVSMLLLAVPKIGWIYMLTALTLGAIFLIKTFGMMRNQTRKSNIGLFRYSLIYLFILFFSVIIDGLL